MKNPVSEATKIAREEIRARHKAEQAKIKKFKHNMEIIRTLCAIGAVTLNIIVLSHIVGLW